MNAREIWLSAAVVGIVACAGRAQVMCGEWDTAPQLGNWGTAIAEFQGEVYVSGYFSGAHGNYVTRWNGSEFVPLPQQPPQRVTSLAEYDDGTGPALYAGGTSWNFSGFPPQTHYGVIKWNGQTWSPTGFPMDPGGDGVTDMIGYDDGQGRGLYVAVPSMSQSSLRRWSNGTWTSVAGAPQQVRTLAVFDDGGGPALHVGGSFMTAGGVPAKNIARLRQGVWSDVGGGVYFSAIGLPSVGCLEVLDLGQGPRLFVGGAFNRAGTVPTNLVASWDGNAWTGYRFLGYPMYQYVPPIVTSLAVLRNTTPPLLLVGTDTFSTIPAGLSGLLAWDGERWFAAGGPATAGVHALLGQEGPTGSKVLVCGWMLGGVSLAEWTPRPQCYANCDWSTTPPILNVNDYLCFMQKFAAGDVWANCDTSSIAPVLNVNDFVCFMGRYGVGCP